MTYVGKSSKPKVTFNISSTEKKKKRFVLIMINECKPFSAGDIALLIWGMWLCYKIRNAPAAYNESKYISWAIYNAMFVTSFLMVVRFVQDYMKYILGCPISL